MPGHGPSRRNNQEQEEEAVLLLPCDHTNTLCMRARSHVTTLFYRTGEEKMMAQNTTFMLFSVNLRTESIALFFTTAAASGHHVLRTLMKPPLFVFLTTPKGRHFPFNFQGNRSAFLFHRRSLRQQLLDHDLVQSSWRRYMNKKKEQLVGVGTTDVKATLSQILWSHFLVDGASTGTRRRQEG